MRAKIDFAAHTEHEQKSGMAWYSGATLGFTQVWQYRPFSELRHTRIFGKMLI